MNVIKNVLKNIIMMITLSLFATTPVFADIVAPAINPVRDLSYYIFDGDEKRFVIGMVVLAVIIAIVCAIIISKQEPKEEDTKKNK